MKKLFAAVGLIFGFCLSTNPAFADLSIKAFEGVWEGSAISENSNSELFPVSVRDMDVEVRLLDQGKFALKWRTVQRQKGAIDNPTEVLRETERVYVPEPGKSYWAAEKSGNPLKGDYTSWAVMAGQTLTVYSMAIRENGTYDMLIYKRTLTGLNMKLEFSAFRNGKLRRTVTGTLIKTGK
ncbi:hypothetical protein [Sneathiella limimaris]|uniref:hypothetical protein n=1 Tax=Sneathiella limimaris TaxID=1964213 RepID=UPI00146D0E27|nr:hypothetical protein [Sneathiella limimaris]